MQNTARPRQFNGRCGDHGAGQEPMCNVHGRPLWTSALGPVRLYVGVRLLAGTLWSFAFPPGIWQKCEQFALKASWKSSGSPVASFYYYRHRSTNGQNTYFQKNVMVLAWESCKWPLRSFAPMESEIPYPQLRGRFRHWNHLRPTLPTPPPHHHTQSLGTATLPPSLITVTVAVKVVAYTSSTKARVPKTQQELRRQH